jgi:glycosyltransferase involved in cell wall biosynthesis
MNIVNLKNNTYIYFDVTQLIHWSGPVAGIPRVMLELAKRFSSENTIYVSWVKEIKSYCVIDLENTLNSNGGIVYKKSNNTNSDDVVKAGKYHPKRIAKAAINRTKYIHPSLPDRINQRRVAIQAQNYIVPDISKNDIIFIPWGEWWDDNFLTMLEDLQDNGVKLSTIIHDVGPMVTPHLSAHSTESLTNYCKRIVPICDVVFVVSKNTKKDLTLWLQENNIAVPKISVFRLGDNFEVKQQKEIKDEYRNIVDKPFIMSVGTIEIKKNHMLLYYVYKLAKSRGINLPNLLVVGRQGWKSEYFVDMVQADPDVNTKIHILTGVGDEELAWLYGKSLVTILPSMYEGWGIPIAESLAYGVPSLSSNVTSMVEIAPGITKHFNPYSTDECLQAISDMIDNIDTEKKSAKSYKLHSWDESYVQISKELNKL